MGVQMQWSRRGGRRWDVGISGRSSSANLPPAACFAWSLGRERPSWSWSPLAAASLNSLSDREVCPQNWTETVHYVQLTELWTSLKVVFLHYLGMFFNWHQGANSQPNRFLVVNVDEFAFPSGRLASALDSGNFCKRNRFAYHNQCWSKVFIWVSFLFFGKIKNLLTLSHQMELSLRPRQRYRKIGVRRSKWYVQCRYRTPLCSRK